MTVRIRDVLREAMKHDGESRYKEGAYHRILERIDGDVIMSPAIVDTLQNLMKEELIYDPVTQS